jgi:hypothetical protein
VIANTPAMRRAEIGDRHAIPETVSAARAGCATNVAGAQEQRALGQAVVPHGKIADKPAVLCPAPTARIPRTHVEYASMRQSRAPSRNRAATNIEKSPRHRSVRVVIALAGRVHHLFHAQNGHEGDRRGAARQHRSPHPALHMRRASMCASARGPSWPYPVSSNTHAATSQDGERVPRRARAREREVTAAPPCHA